MNYTNFKVGGKFRNFTKLYNGHGTFYVTSQILHFRRSRGRLGDTRVSPVGLQGTRITRQ